jgi:small subunit ribosomal protein S16
MLAIRLQRQGKTHFATYRIIVQEAQKQPTSGKVVAFIGAYNPHSKEVSVAKEVAQKYLDNGAQPTPRVAKLLKENGVKLPKWVTEFDGKGAKKTRNPEKLRKNQPKEEKPVEASAVEATEKPAEETVAEPADVSEAAETEEKTAE